MRRLTALLAALLLLACTGCAANPSQPESTSSPAQADETQADFQVESAYPLEYAKEFTVDECTGGTRLITIQNARYLVVPENSTVPNGLSEDITVLQKPLENVYLVSTSAMDPILKLDARSAVTLSGTSAENWYLPEAKEAMENGEVVIMSAGTGNPFFTTDTGSSLRGIEIEADVMLKGTRVDGIYTADPEKDPTATKFDEITYDEVLARGLKVMDLTATCMCKENNLPIIVFDMDTVGNLKKVISGENIGTMVHP